ncbi:hypothetical protein [Rubritalea tangerina]
MIKDPHSLPFPLQQYISTGKWKENFEKKRLMRGKLLFEKESCHPSH